MSARALEDDPVDSDAELEAELAGLDEEPGPLPEPEPQEHLRRRPRRRDDEEEPAQDLAPVEGPRKRVRQREEDTQVPPASAAPTQAPNDTQTDAPVKEEPAAPAPAPAPQQQQAGDSQSEDQVAAALMRLSAHVSNPSKYLKAAPLLRQLLESGTLTREHRPLVFDAVRAIFSLQKGRHKHVVDVTSRRETTKLMQAVDSLLTSQYFTRAEREQITHVYVLLASVCLGMLTDDSFMFSKVITKLKGHIDELPSTADEDTQEETAAYTHVTMDLPGEPTQQPAPAPPTTQAPAPAPTAAPPQPPPVPQPPAPPPASDPSDDPFGLDAFMEPQTQTAAPAEDDPFGLGALMGQPARRAPERPKPVPKHKPVELPSTAWNATQLLAAKRCVLLTCVQHARTFHKHTWAQSSIETLAEHVWNHRDRFSSAQQEEIDELWRWVRQARAARKMGPSAKEINRDSTSFERARSEWSRATVSARGKVGAGGDAKSAQWLG